MPMHDFECVCGHAETDVYLHRAPGQRFCSECGGVMEQTFRPSTKCRPFRKYWDKHIAEKPVFITSERQREREMKERNVDYYSKPGEPGCMV